MNTLYYGDNLNILRRYIKDESGAEADSQMLKIRLEGNFGLLPIGTRTFLSASRASLADGVGDPSTVDAAGSGVADKDVRVPTYLVVGEPGRAVIDGNHRSGKFGVRLKRRENGSHRVAMP